MTGALRLEGATVTPRDTEQPLFAALSLAIEPGEILSVMGPSGIGKSTLIDWIGGHLGTHFRGVGRVVLAGRDVTELPAEQRGIGVLFQDAALFPHLSVGENLSFGLTPAVRGRAARRAAVDHALSGVGLAGLARRDPATLSGGQRARVALMRALLAAPRALLLDEPFSRLDAATRDEVRALVFERLRQAAIPALMVTHDPDDATAAGGRVVSLLPPEP